jgi:hypothetical protein
MNPAPFFIVGSGRSGSTLLRVILASHSRIAIPPETYFLLPLVRELSIDRPLSREEVERAVKIITEHYRWPDMDFEADEFRREASALAAPNLRDVVEVIYQRFLEREGKRRWGDKTPPYIRIVPQLAKLYPDARFIHLVRDGRDVAKSFQSVGWYGPRLHDNTYEWNDALALAERWRPLVKERFLQLRYEDLVRDTEKVVRNACAFLGEDFEPGMLAWEEKVDRLVPDREKYIHEKLKRRPNDGDIARWRREMPTREVFVAEAFMGANLERAGYARKFAGPLWSPPLLLAKGYCRFVLPFAGRVVRAFRAVQGDVVPDGRREATRSQGKS